MKIIRVISMIPFLIFCSIMILFFYNGFLYPIVTDFWIVRYGIPVLIFELCSIFMIFFLLSITSKEKKFTWLIFIFFFIMPIIFSFFLTYIFNIYMFPYFLLSIFIKFIVFRKIDESHDFTGVIITILSIPLSMAIGAIFNSMILDRFPYQSGLINSYMDSLAKSSGNMNNPAGFFALWGIFYFSFLILFTLLFEILIWRKKLKNKILDGDLT